MAVDVSEQRERTVLNHCPPSPVPSFTAKQRPVVSPFLASTCRSTVDTSASSINFTRLDTSDDESSKNVMSSADSGRCFNARRQRSLASRYSDSACIMNASLHCASPHRKTAERNCSRFTLLSNVCDYSGHQSF